MITGFQAYWQSRKPLLDAALSRVMGTLLDGITVNDAASLKASLEAGKKIRAGLTFLISEALGATIDSIVPRAISIEMIQAATLLHDDFVDQDVQRRGAAATWTIEGARRAVLIGDVIFAYAIKMMSDLGREDGAVVAHAIAQVSRGALHEPLDALALADQIEAGNVDRRLFNEVIRLKTGILFGAACHIGAIAAHAVDALQDASYRYGLRIGEAYQIADDLQEIETLVTSKSIYQKQIVALAPALLFFTGEMQPEIVGLLRKEPETMDGVGLDLLHTAQELMKKEIEHRLESATDEVEKNFPQNGYIEALRGAPREIIKMFNES